MGNEATFSIAGILFMVTVWGAIIGLTIFCFYHILRDKEEQIVGPLEVEAEIDKEEKLTHE